jgi:hypothetical protein
LYLFFSDSSGDSSLAFSGYNSIPAGAGTLSLDVNSSTRRIKAYWNGVLKIDFTETDTSRQNSGNLMMSVYGDYATSVVTAPAIFDDLLAER